MNDNNKRTAEEMGFAIQKPQIAYINLGKGVACALYWWPHNGQIEKIVIPAVTHFSEQGIDHMKSVIADAMGIPQVGIPIEIEDPIAASDNNPRLSFPFRDVQAFQRKFRSCLPDKTRVPHLPEWDYVKARVEFYEEEMSEMHRAFQGCKMAKANLDAFWENRDHEPINNESETDAVGEFKALHEEYVKWLVHVADAHFDLVWILYGTMDGMGIPFSNFWNEGYRANMDKVYDEEQDGADGTYKFGITKPDGWVGPEPRMNQLFLAMINHGRETQLIMEGNVEIVETDTGYTIELGGNAE